jgi:hypothetical protein
MLIPCVLPLQSQKQKYFWVSRYFQRVYAELGWKMQHKKCFLKILLKRCLPFDKHAAIVYAELVAHRKRIGKPVCTEDAQIAAIAVTENLTLVTRNIKYFTEIEGLKLINPWETA